MSPDETPNDTAKRPKFMIIAALAVLAAVAVGGVLGVFTYRTYLNNKDDEPVAQAESGVGAGIVEKQNNGAPGERFDAQFNTDTMYPNFHPDRHFYVTRCIPGKVKVQVNALNGSTVQVDTYPARTGRFAAEPRPLPGQDFNITIETDEGTSRYQVRCLPDDFPVWDYARMAKPPTGMFFVSFRDEPKDSSRSWLVVFDQEGTPRWWFNPPTNALGGQILPDGTAQWPTGYGDGFGKDPRTRNEIRTLDGRLIRTIRTEDAPTDGHEYKLLPNGNVLINSYKPRLGVDLSSVGGKEDVGVLDGEIQEVTPSGKVVWKWNSGDHVPLSYTPKRWWNKILNNAHVDPDGNERHDIFHFNSAEPWGKDQLVISSRHTDKVLGISRKTGKILWTFGGDPDPKSLEVKGNDPHADYPVGGSHDARMSDGNLLSIHDNRTNLEQRPRLVRYRINLKNRTATFESQSIDPEAKRSHCCGGARPFGGGWIVAWGENPFVTAYNAEDELAFRLTLPIPVYRAVPVPPSVTAEDLDRGLDRMEPEIPMADEPTNPIIDYGK
ncbi:MAG: aryl-sulfate sulfotransferase [Actinomycetota bacterium]|nr:aryl-sulfate sulfotransferase [Actinomycetota bacterium]